MQVSTYLVVGALLGLIVAGGPLGALIGCITALLFMIVNQYRFLRTLGECFFLLFYGYSKTKSREGVHYESGCSHFLSD